MRKLAHPIAIFIVTVLVVIGAGVGIMAVTQTSNVYGPSWGRFTASFPGRMCRPSSQVRTRVTFHYENASSFDSKCPTGWIGYAPLAYPLELDSVDVYGHLVTASAMRGYVRLERLLLFSGHVAEHARSLNGFTETTLGPQCSGKSCMAVEYVSNGRVLWTLTAISPRSLSAVEGFLASFQPIG